LADGDTKVSISGSKIIYEGYLNERANEEIFQIHSKNKSSIKSIQISSRGGDVNLGMDLGEFIFDNNLDVHVQKYCLSSCANYVFTSGKLKILGKNSVIGFHGGANSQSFDNSMLEKLPEEERMRAFRALKLYLKSIRDRESHYYNKIGVDNRIVYLGQNAEYTKYEKNGYSGWYYSVGALNKLGVNNISVTNPPWRYVQFDEGVKLFEIDEDSI